ncbi:MAG TPA: tetratricopeptide repeat-containing serine protease family protein [Allocoleopsis sp.]
MKKSLSFILISGIIPLLLMPNTQAQILPNSVNLAQAKNTNIAQKSNYTGIVGKIDKIAAQITVKINSENNDQGSGVIVGKNGQDYYVLTSGQMVTDFENKILPVNITTPDKQKYSVSTNQITRLEGVDLAIVKFTSNQSYQVATLGKYNLGESWIFLSGFIVNNQRLLTGGILRSPEEADFLAKDSYSLSTGGFNLLYTNMSYPGMGGGPILDHNGRLIGIHTASESEFIGGNVVNLGHSIGISISTFISLANRAKIKPQWLKIATNKPAEITITEIKSIKSQLLTLKSPKKDDFAEWMNYGNYLWRISEYEKSVTAYDKAIKLMQKQPNYSKQELAKAYYGKGVSLISVKKNNDAVKSFDLATQNDPQFYQGWRGKGLTFYLLQKYPDSLIAYDQAIKINNTDFILFVERGDTLRKLKRYQEAIANYDQAIKIKPHPWAYKNRDIVYEELKNKQ